MVPNWPEAPLADLATLRMISVAFSSETFSPGPNFFSSSATCLLIKCIFTLILRRRPNRMFFLLFNEFKHLNFVYGYVY